MTTKMVSTFLLACLLTSHTYAVDFKVSDGKFWTNVVPNGSSGIPLNEDGESEFFKANDLIERIAYANDDDTHHLFVRRPQHSDVIFAIKKDPLLARLAESPDNHTFLAKVIPHIDRIRNEPAYYGRDLWCRVLGWSDDIRNKQATMECELRENKYTNQIK